MTKIKNNTGSHKVWLGQLITSGQYFTIPEDQSHKWAYDNELLQDITSGLAIVNNGVSDFTDVTSGINFLQSTDADYIKGVLVDDSSKGDAKVLCYNLAGDKIQYDDISTLSIFGSEFQQVESESQSSTTSQTFQQKLRLTTTSLPSGTYRIGWHAVMKSSALDKRTKFQVELDDTTVIATALEEPDHANNKFPHSGFKYEVLNGVHTIDIDYGCDESSMTAYIEMARIELWRVG